MKISVCLSNHGRACIIPPASGTGWILSINAGKIHERAKVILVVAAPSVASRMAEVYATNKG
jgi:hypothetical protein